MFSPVQISCKTLIRKSDPNRARERRCKEEWENKGEEKSKGEGESKGGEK